MGELAKRPMRLVSPVRHAPERLDPEMDPSSPQRERSTSLRRHAFSHGSEQTYVA